MMKLKGKNGQPLTKDQAGKIVLGGIRGKKSGTRTERKAAKAEVKKQCRMLEIQVH